MKTTAKILKIEKTNFKNIVPKCTLWTNEINNEVLHLMKRTSVLFCTLAFTFQGLGLYAQGNLFELKKIKNCSFTQKTQVLNPNGKVTQEGTMTTTIRVDKENNTLTQIRHTSGGRKDSTVCSLLNMKPIYFSTKGEGMNQIIEHQPNKVNVFVNSDGRKISKGSFDVSNDVYDYFMDTYIVSLLPLKVGFKGSFKVFSGFVNTELLFEVQNVTKDFILTSQKKYVPAYLVVCENAGVKVTMWFDISTNDLIRFIAYLPNGQAFVRDLVYEKKELDGFEVYNREIKKVFENGKEFIQLSESEGAGVAWINGKEFSEGTIEFDARGRDLMQKSFIGVAFHGVDNNNYETVYFRPFNFQATDSIRRAHAIQYTFEPKYNYQTLRNTRKDEFEGAMLPSIIKPTDWFHAKIVVKSGRIKVFVNNSANACLDVSTLNPQGKKGKIGFFVGNNSSGDFANLLISN